MTTRFRHLRIVAGGAALAAIASYFFACGSGLDTPATIADCDASLTFDGNIRSIVATTGTGRCAACHAGRYDSLSGISNSRASVYKSVNGGSMPQGQRGFKDTADGKTFLAWVSCKTLK